jgi:hypothetical protein
LHDAQTIELGRFSIGKGGLPFREQKGGSGRSGIKQLIGESLIAESLSKPPQQSLATVMPILKRFIGIFSHRMV